MNKKILLTRPRSSSENLAKLLSYRGFSCLIEPLLTIEPIDRPRPPGLFEASMITSASAFEVLSDKKSLVSDLFSLPCFCVGEATGEAARRFGFSDVRCGDSDSSALAQKIIADKKSVKNLLHISGDVVDGKAAAIFYQQGITMTPWLVYHASAATDFTREIDQAFRAGDISTIVLFSPRSAQILVTLLQKSGLIPACATLTVIALSQAIAYMLRNVRWQEIRVAAAPLEEEVLTCLGKHPDDTDRKPA